MTNDSSTGGYLVASGAAPMYGPALEHFVQGVIVGVAGFADPTKVRRKFQPIPPTQPDPTADWIAFAVTTQDGSDYPVDLHQGAANGGQGQDLQLIYEGVRVEVSVYGPNAALNAGNLRAGMYVGQNREPLLLQSMGLTEVTSPVRAPELVNNQWIDRYDLAIVLTRELSRTFPVLNLERAVVAIKADGGFTDDFMAG